MGVIAVLIEDNTNAWAGELVKGVEGVAHAAGYQTFVCDTHFDHKVERSYVEKMLSLGVDGFVIQPTTHYRSIGERLRRAGKPVVFFDFSNIDLTTTWVKTDLYGSVYDAISRCASRGYEEFLMLAAPIRDARSRSERFSGFFDALEEHGIEPKTMEISHASPSEDELRHHFTYEMSTARSTLVFCPHQWALARVFRALDGQRHLIPERIGLLGLNNAGWTDLTRPAISTIVEPVTEEGRIACSLLIELIDNPETQPTQRMLACETRWLESTR